MRHTVSVSDALPWWNTAVVIARAYYRRTAVRYATHEKACGVGGVGGAPCLSDTGSHIAQLWRRNL